MAFLGKFSGWDITHITWINFFAAFLTLFIESKAAPESACPQFFYVNIRMEVYRVSVTGSRGSGELIWRVLHTFEEGVSVHVAPHISSDIGLTCNKGHDLVGFVLIHDTHNAITVVKVAASAAWVIAEVVF